MHLLFRRKPGEHRMTDVGKEILAELFELKTPARHLLKVANCGAQDVSRRIELAVAAEKRIPEFSRAQGRMPPGGGGRVVSIQVLFGDPAVSQELIILLRSRNGRQYVKRSNARIEPAQHIE